MIQIPFLILGLGSLKRGMIYFGIILFVFLGLWGWPGYLLERTFKCEEEPVLDLVCDNELLISSIIGLVLMGVFWRVGREGQ